MLRFSGKICMMSAVVLLAALLSISSAFQSSLTATPSQRGVGVRHPPSFYSYSRSKVFAQQWSPLYSSSSSSDETNDGADEDSTDSKGTSVEDTDVEITPEEVAGEDSTDSKGTSVEDTDVEITPEEVSRVQRWRQKLFPKKQEGDDGLTFKQKLAKLGLSVVLSYGFVSNVSYSITVSIAWFLFSKQTGLSPLAQGQWPKFLAVYSGFWIFNNFIRPLRLTLSIAVSTKFDNIVNMVETKFRVKRGVAIGITVFLANVVGTISLMCAGISIASIAAGVPIFVKK